MQTFGYHDSLIVHCSPNEYTLVICLSDTDPEQVHAAADDLILRFNQSSVLIQANKTATEFYSGGNDKK